MWHLSGQTFPVWTALLKLRASQRRAVPELKRHPFIREAVAA